MFQSFLMLKRKRKKKKIVCRGASTLFRFFYAWWSNGISLSHVSSPRLPLGCMSITAWESAARVPFRHLQKVFLGVHFSFVLQGHVSFLREELAFPTHSSFSRQLSSDTWLPWCVDILFNWFGLSHPACPARGSLIIDSLNTSASAATSLPRALT